MGNPGFKDAVNHLKDVKFSLNPDQELIAEETTIKPHPVDSDSEYAPACLNNHDEEKAEPFTMHTLNESPDGCCISWEGENPPKIKVGEVLGIQAEEDSETYSIGISRWIRNTRPEGLQIGMELIQILRMYGFLLVICL